MRVRSSRFLLPALLWALPAVVSAQAAPPLSAADLGALRLRNIGPASMSGRVVDMDVVESNPSTWYVAGATGGLWRTEDNGVTWASTFDAPVHSIGDVAVFQPNPQILWVGTGERASRQSVGWGDGVYKSTDGGKTWQNMGLATSMHIGRIQLHPRDPNIAYVAAQGSVWGAGGERGLERGQGAAGGARRAPRASGHSEDLNGTLSPALAGERLSCQAWRMAWATGLA